MMAAIFVFSSIPSSEMPTFSFADLLIKKGGHLLGYGLLALSYMHGLGEHLTQKPDQAFRAGPNLAGLLILAWALSVLYALTDEFHQSFVPGRNASLVDIGIDAIGAAGMILLYRLWKISRNKRT
jgi:VanZ family protein